VREGGGREGSEPAQRFEAPPPPRLPGAVVEKEGMGGGRPPAPEEEIFEERGEGEGCGGLAGERIRSGWGSRGWWWDQGGARRERGVAGSGGAERLCHALQSERMTKLICLPCALKKGDGKHFFYNFIKFIKISNKFLKILKLTQIKLCFLLLTK
jgi:hypothetical protein